MLTLIFVIPANHKYTVEYDCDKSGLACCLYGTKSGWRCICHFPSPLAYNLLSPPANGKQGPIPDETQTLLTNKKQGNLDYVPAANIIKPT